jgi:hypothetical protein
MSGAQQDYLNELKAKAAGTYVEPRNPWNVFGVRKTEKPSSHEPEKPAECYTADVVDGKYVCPICKNVEGGTMRIITHNFNCPNRGKKYCQAGGSKRRGNKRRRTTRKGNRKTRKQSRRTRR